MAQQTCETEPETNCGATTAIAKATLDSSPYPFTSDINFDEDGIATLQGDPFLLSDFTVLDEGCVDIDKENIRASTAFSAILRAYFRVKEATAPANSVVQVRFVLDGTVVSFQSKKLSGTYPDGYSFDTGVHNVPAGLHAYKVEARLWAETDETATIDAAWIGSQLPQRAEPRFRRGVGRFHMDTHRKSVESESGVQRRPAHEPLRHSRGRLGSESLGPPNTRRRRKPP
jgi:hypothetical protein